jgi:hypothetical protein
MVKGKEFGAVNMMELLYILVRKWNNKLHLNCLKGGRG